MVAETVQRIEAGQGHQLGGDMPRFFPQLAHRAVEGPLAWFEAAGRELPVRLAVGVAVLSDHHDPTVGP